ncbi:MAG TPA: hypothetical protein VF157_10215 [Chloroflexota bacterium]
MKALAARASGWLWLGIAFLAMFGVVMFVVAAADHVLWIMPAGGCLIRGGLRLHAAVLPAVLRPLIVRGLGLGR